MFNNPENPKARAAFEQAATKAAGREVVIESDSVSEVIAYTPEAEELLASARRLIAEARPDADEAESLDAVFAATGVLAQAARLAPLAERWAERGAEVTAAVKVPECTH
jgi:F0F1-type ATP synthase delta subunit